MMYRKSFLWTIWLLILFITSFYSSSYFTRQFQLAKNVLAQEDIYIPPTQIEARTHAKVFAISLPNTYLIKSVEEQASELITQLKEGTRYRGYNNPNSQPYLEYQLYNNQIHYETTYPPRYGGGVNSDLGTLYDKYNICSLVQSGEVDEVWIWTNGQSENGGMSEWITTGSGWGFDTTNHTPNCGKQVSTLVFNSSRPIGSALHSCAHRIEGLANHFFPCDYTPEFRSNCVYPPGSASGFGSTYLKSGNIPVSGCGTVHVPPNITTGGDYQYNSTTPASSICKDWSLDGSSTSSSINCNDWGCTEEGYVVWWMQNIPGLNNVSKSRTGEPLPNWWTYLFTASPPPSPTPTATPPMPTIASPVTLIFLPTSDSMTKSTSGNSNYGTIDYMRIRKDVSAGTHYQSYLKFNISGATDNITNVKLRIYSYDGSSKPSSIYLTDNDWSEKTITWNNAPALGTKLNTVSSVISNSWVEYDITSAISTNGTYSFVLVNVSDNSIYFKSKESETNMPELRVESVGGQIISTPTPTPTTNTSDPHIYLPTSDSMTKSTSGNSNYGTLEYLRIRKDIGTGTHYKSYVKFDVGNISTNIVSAKLRIYSYDGSSKPSSIYATNNNWEENTITWNNAPENGQKLDSLSLVNDNTWVEYDATSTVTGSGTYSFVLQNESDTSIYFNSRENVANNPELRIITQ